MLVSLEKQSDLEVYRDLLECLEIALRVYQKQPSESLKARIEEISASVDEFRKHIDTEDYARRDEQRRLQEEVMARHQRTYDDLRKN